MKPILLFDLDNTILDFDSGEKAALTAVFERHGIAVDPKLLHDYHHINIKYWEMLERGELSRIEVLEGRFDELFRLYGMEHTGRQIQGEYERELANHHDFMPGARELLEEIYEKYDLYIVSNGCADIQKPRIEGAGLKKYFKDFFVSESIGFDKPSREFFDCCFKQIPSFSKERSLIIGDSLTSDIKGGRNAGVKTCWFNYSNRELSGKIKPDEIIYALNELPKLIVELFKLTNY